MSYADLYASPLQHPWILWIAAALGLLAALSRRDLSREARWFCLALTAVALLDAWLTADRVLGLGALKGSAATWVPLLFVLLGDFRYFFFVESARPDGRLAVGSKGLWTAAAWTLVVPIGAQLLVHAIGAQEPRVLFLVYEVLFVALLFFMSRVYLPRHAKALRWTRLMTRFGIAYYGLWAVADAIILFSGADEGFLLRVVPNLLYYGGFVPAVAWTAPRKAAQ